MTILDDRWKICSAVDLLTLIQFGTTYLPTTVTISRQGWGRERERAREHTRQEALPLILAATPNSIAPVATRDLMEAQADSSAAEPLRDREFQKLLKSSSSASLTSEASHNVGTPSHHGSQVLITEKRQPLSSVSSLEVHFDLLDLTELTDMSDQELGEVFADSDEENHTESPAIRPTDRQQPPLPRFPHSGLEPGRLQGLEERTQPLSGEGTFLVKQGDGEPSGSKDMVIPLKDNAIPSSIMGEKTCWDEYRLFLKMEQTSSKQDFGCLFGT
ncbi:dysbindin domain-containing protein [Pimephales promelas]|nr:dysbindin domain-containing protein [Pimephales promelas]